MPTKSSSPGPWVHGVGVTLALTQVLFLPSAHSPFRVVKEAWALSTLSVLVAVVCLVAARRNTLRLPHSGLAAALLGLPLLTALSGLWATDPRRAVFGAATTAVWSAAAIVVSGFSDAQRRVLTLWVAAGAALSSLVLIGQFFNLPLVSLPGRAAADRLRLIGTSGNPADAAMAGVLVLPLLIPLVARPLKRHRIIAICMIAIIAGAILSQSLTAWVSLGLIALLMLLVHRSRALWLSAATVAVLAIVVIGASPLSGRVAAIPTMIAEGDWNRILSARTDGWTAALTMFTSQPATGVGNDNYSREFFSARAAYLERGDDHGNRGEVSTHFERAHNDPLEMLAEMGLVGLVWMGLFTWVLVRAVPDRLRLALAACAWLPFLMLHFPTHLAVGALPGCLLLAEFLSRSPRRHLPGPPIVDWLLVLFVLAGGWWTVDLQLRTVRLDLWRGAAEYAVTTSQSVPAAERRPVLASLEQQAAIQIARHPVHAGWIWRLIGKARLVDGRAAEAEGAFRRAAVLMPHEEAAFGLGEALLRQGRYSEAIESYGPVVRMNPVLIEQIPSAEMQRLLRERLWGRATGAR
jgi:O-antigen ligase